MNKKQQYKQRRYYKSFLSQFDDNITFTKSDIESIILLAVTETFGAAAKGYFNHVDENLPHQGE